MDDQSCMTLEAIKTIVEKRQETFGKVLVGLAFSRDNTKDWRVCFGLVKFLRKGETLKETTYNYGDFILTKRLLEVPDALNFIHLIIENQILKVSGWSQIPIDIPSEIELKVRLPKMRFLQSRSHYGYISSEWPMVLAYGRIEDSTRGEIPSDSLSKIKTPLFPDGKEAIDVFFNLRIPIEWHTLTNEFVVLVPDYRARITSLRLAGNRVTVEVETLAIDPHDVRAQFYCKSENQSYMSNDLPLEAGCATYVADDEPLLVETHILSVLDDKSIDKRKFDYRYPSREEGVIIENIEAQLLDMIEKGENVTVEFKKTLGKKERIRKDFLETVVAFANAKGGTIFLGVDDNCRIQGFEEEDVKDRIEDMIADSCDPPIEVQVESVFVHEKPITLVNVPAGGKNRPYILRGRGIFVRRGSSDRQIQRKELDDIYTNKKQRI